MSTQTEPVTFLGSLGEKLSAELELPEDEAPRGIAVFAHCFTCSKNLKVVKHISEELASFGIGVFRFDFTGLGSSGGEFQETSFSSNIGDVVAASDWVAENYEAPSLLIGHSLGGSAVVRAARRIKSVRAVATLGAPFDPEHVALLFREAESEIRERGEATVSIGGRPFRIGRDFLEDLTSHSLEEDLRQLGRALLVLHSPVDSVVSIDNAARIFQAAKHPKSFLSLDQADHLLMKKEDSRFAARMIGVWADRYI